MKRLYSQLTYYLCLLLVLWVILCEWGYWDRERVWGKPKQGKKRSTEADKGE